MNLLYSKNRLKVLFHFIPQSFTFSSSTMFAQNVNLTQPQEQVAGQSVS